MSSASAPALTAFDDEHGPVSEISPPPQLLLIMVFHHSNRPLIKISLPRSLQSYMVVFYLEQTTFSFFFFFFGMDMIQLKSVSSGTVNISSGMSQGLGS